MDLHLTAVVAMTPDRIIGLDGKLPWHLPADLAFFKRTTSGHPIIMGRKTFESIGRPLPNRRNIVLTRDPSWSAPGVEVIQHVADLATLPSLTGNAFIIGGAEIYAALLPATTDLLVTHVFHPYPGDTVLPPFEHEFPYSEVIESHPDFEVRRHFRRPHP